MYPSALEGFCFSSSRILPFASSKRSWRRRAWASAKRESDLEDCRELCFMGEDCCAAFPGCENKISQFQEAAYLHLPARTSSGMPGKAAKEHEGPSSARITSGTACNQRINLASAELVEPPCALVARVVMQAKPLSLFLFPARPRRGRRD